MKKLIAWLVSVLVVVCSILLILPHFVGKSIERQAIKVVATLSKQARVPMKFVSYHRHWFSSDAVVLLSKPGKPVEKISLRIYNGPIIFAAHQSVFAWAGLSGQLSKLYGTTPPLSGQLSYLGKLKLSIVLKKVIAPILKNKGHIKFAKGSFIIPSIWDFQHQKFVFKVRGLDLQGKQAAGLQLKKGKLSFDLIKGKKTDTFRLNKLILVDLAYRGSKKTVVELPLLEFDGLTVTGEQLKKADLSFQALRQEKVKAAGLGDLYDPKAVKAVSLLAADILAKGLRWHINGLVVSSPQGEGSLTTTADFPVLRTKQPTLNAVMAGLRATVNLQVPSVQLERKGRAFSLRGLSYVGDRDSGVGKVKGVWSLGNLVITEKGQPDFQVNSLKMVSTRKTDFEKSESNLDFNGELAKLCFSGQCNYDLKLNASATNLRLTGEKLSDERASLSAKRTALFKEAMVLKKKIKSSQPGSVEQKNAMNSYRRVLMKSSAIRYQVLKTYLRATTRLALNFSGQTAYGSVDVKGQLGFPQLPKWFTNPNIELNASIAKRLLTALVPQYAPMVASFARQGYVSDNGLVYTVKGSYADHKIELNGQSLR